MALTGQSCNLTGQAFSAHVQSTEVHARPHRPPGHRVVKGEKAGPPGVGLQILHALPEFTEPTAVIVLSEQFSDTPERLHVVGKQTWSHVVSPCA
jgi:hypothetical protein